jgi:alpha-beta hydrolase superfamily lysophospholipase
VRRRRERLIRALLAVAVVAVAWVAADFGYSRVVAWRLARWEASIERGANGIQVGASAYEIGEGPQALLLVHGIGDTPRQWHKMAPTLAAEGLTCRVMRMPGFGEPIERYAVVTRERWVAAVRDELAALRKRHDRVVVVAHSLGAAATIAALLDEPAAAAGAVLLAPLVDVSGARSPLLSTRAWHAISNRIFLFTKITETPFPIHAHDPEERDHPGRLRFTPRSVFDQVYALIDANEARLGEFATPLVGILAMDDRVVDNDAASRFFIAAAQPKIVFQVDAGHAIPVDFGWEDVAADIAEYARSGRWPE